MGRLYLKEKEGKFYKLAKRLGALYIEDGDKAIFVKPGQWSRKGGKSFKPAILWVCKGSIDIGQISKECNNFEDKVDKYYGRGDVIWIVKTLKLLNETKL